MLLAVQRIPILNNKNPHPSPIHRGMCSACLTKGHASLALSFPRNNNKTHVKHNSGDYGLSAPRNPQELREMSQARIKVNALVSAPAREDTKGATTMAWFYRDSLERDVLQDFFQVQVGERYKLLVSFIFDGLLRIIYLGATDQQRVQLSQQKHGR